VDLNRWERMLDTAIDAAATYGLRALGAVAIVVIGYFVFLFRASDKEYREVIAEKFNGK